MSKNQGPDWDVRSPAVQQDQLAAYDALRESRGVAASDMLGWSVFRHADVLRVIGDHETFSSVVSQHVAVPNGMDPPEHTAYRRLIEPFFDARAVAAIEPDCERIAGELLQALRGASPSTTANFISTVSLPFAARVQCVFLGWPESLQHELVDWIVQHHRASYQLDRETLAVLGVRFEALVDRMLGERQAMGDAAPDDATTALLRAGVKGVPLSRSALASILRNWTVGEIGTIAAALGILAEWLARHRGLQQRLRAEPALQAEAIEEILRLHGPLAVNRRVTTCPVQVGGQAIGSGERVTVHWTAANRDPRVFEAPDEFRFGRDPRDNLLYGAGIHVCPGAPLARAELAAALRVLLQAAAEIEPVADVEAVRARYPAMGFSTLALRLHWR